MILLDQIESYYWHEPIIDAYYNSVLMLSVLFLCWGRRSHNSFGHFSMSVASLATRGPGLCHNDEFQCQTDGFCIPNEWECDGHPDCEDGSDEHNSCPPVTCRPNYFQCANKLCVPRSWLCDGDNDCRDMSDEQNCPTPPFRCPSDQWQCPTDQLCIDLDKVCNGQRDCPNGADESPICSEFQ